MTVATLCDRDKLGVRAALEARGFAPGTPAHISRDSEIDLCEMLDEMTCGGCGAVGLDYMSFHAADRFVAVGVCAACGAEEEV